MELMEGDGSLLEKMKKVCVDTMKYRLSGKRSELKKELGSSRDNDDSQSTVARDVDGRTSVRRCMLDFFSEGPYSFFANRCSPCFEKKPETEPLRTLKEVLGNDSYVTHRSWTLEKLFCRRGGLNSAIVITQGESKVTPPQIYSSIACNVLGAVLIILLSASGLVWLGLPSAALGIAIFFVLVAFGYVGFATYRLLILTGDTESNTLFRRWKLYISSEPKDFVTWSVISCEMVFFYLLPLIYLIVRKSPGAIVSSSKNAPLCTRLQLKELRTHSPACLPATASCLDSLGSSLEGGTT